MSGQHRRAIYDLHTDQHYTTVAALHNGEGGYGSLTTVRMAEYRRSGQHVHMSIQPHNIVCPFDYPMRERQTMDREKLEGIEEY